MMKFKSIAVAVLILGFFVIAGVSRPSEAASFPDPRLNVQVIASSTPVSLTAGASVRVLATSTTPGVRMATSFQAVNCGTGGVVYLQFNDKAAVAGTGYFLNGSSTVIMADQIPVTYGAIQAVSSSANCTLLVTEFRGYP